jgi:hypothetical protein
MIPRVIHVDSDTEEDLASSFPPRPQQLLDANVVNSFPSVSSGSNTSLGPSSSHPNIQSLVIEQETGEQAIEEALDRTRLSTLSPTISPSKITRHERAPRVVTQFEFDDLHGANSSETEDEALDMNDSRARHDDEDDDDVDDDDDDNADDDDENDGEIVSEEANNQSPEDEDLDSSLSVSNSDKRGEFLKKPRLTLAERHEQEMLRQREKQRKMMKKLHEDRANHTDDRTSGPSTSSSVQYSSSRVSFSSSPSSSASMMMGQQQQQHQPHGARSVPSSSSAYPQPQSQARGGKEKDVQTSKPSPFLGTFAQLPRSPSSTQQPQRTLPLPSSSNPSSTSSRPLTPSTSSTPITHIVSASSSRLNRTPESDVRFPSQRSRSNKTDEGKQT